MRIVRLAKTIEEERPGILRGINILSALDLSHSEARLHEVIRDWGLTLGVEMIHLRQGLMWIPLLHVPAWMAYMLHHEPRVLLGGFTLDEEDDIRAHLGAFWGAFELEEPSHQVYAVHKHNLQRCIPYYLYLDEGRGYRKSPVMILAFEACFGTSTRKNYKQRIQQTMVATERDRTLACLDSQAHTSKGSSLTSRFLLTALPHSWYRKTKHLDRSHVFHNTLEEIAKHCESLFREGIKDRAGNTWFGILVGLKGDSPALAKAGRLTASFMNLGANRRMCHHCQAGLDPYPWEDMTDSAAWIQTQYTQRPWAHPSALLQIPFNSVAPERLFKNDPFHVVKYGIGRHFTASSIIVLITTMAVWPAGAGGSNSVEACLERAYQDFRQCCRHILRTCPHCKMFTREILHFTKNSSFPFAGWKGSDTMAVCRWLNYLIRHGAYTESNPRPNTPLGNLVSQDHGEILEAIRDGALSLIVFFDILNKNGLWLSRTLALKASDAVDMFAGSYCTLAVFSLYCVTS